MCVLKLLSDVGILVDHLEERTGFFKCDLAKDIQHIEVARIACHDDRAFYFATGFTDVNVHVPSVEAAVHDLLVRFLLCIIALKLLVVGIRKTLFMTVDHNEADLFNVFDHVIEFLVFLLVQHAKGILVEVQGSAFVFLVQDLGGLRLGLHRYGAGHEHDDEEVLHGSMFILLVVQSVELIQAMNIHLAADLADLLQIDLAEERQYHEVVVATHDHY